MTLDEYLSQPGAPTLSDFAASIKVRSVDQVRQWRHRYANRQPGTKNSNAIVRVTNGKVREWDLRPEDWWEHWPHLVGKKGAPAVPRGAEA